MKKLLVIICMLFSTTVNATVIVENNDTKMTFNEPEIKEIITVDTPSYGIKIFLKNGKSYYIQGDTRASAVLMLQMAYYDLQKYYGWSDRYLYNIMEQQDKAKLGIH